jgi:hypothetical protein
VRLCLLVVVMFVWAVWPPARARAQSGTDVSPAIPVHPDVPTILRLPDEIAGVWSIGNRMVMVKGVGNELYLRPRPDTPAGAEALIEVKTRTLHRIFHVRVVERAEDAMSVIVVQAPATEACAEAAPGASSSVRSPTETPASTPSPAPGLTKTTPGTPEPATMPAEPEPATTAITERASSVGSSRFELSVHAVGALVGTTEITVPGYETTLGRKSHRTIGIRFTVARRDAPWALEANLGGEWLVAPTVHTKNGNGEFTEELHVGGPWLRVDGGLRMRAGARLAPTAYAAFGLLAHHRDIETGAGSKLGETMPFLGVLVLGMGLEHRAGNLLLGLDFQVRQGVPAEYRSVTWLLSAGYILDQGE